MAGLLGKKARLRGLLSGMVAQDPVMDPRLGPRPEAAPVDMGRKTEAARTAGQRGSLLAAMSPRPEPERNRVSGWRVLDGVLGGKTVSESLDAEREREAALAAGRMGPDPRLMAVAQTITDPRELALFSIDPEAWSKNVGQQFAPQVVGAGAAQVIGGRRTVDQPQNIETGDQIVSANSTGARPIYERTTPSISEGIAQENAQTGRINAITERDRGVTLSPGQVAARLDGTTYATGAPRILSALQGTDLVTEDGRQLYENAPAPQQAPANVQEAQARVTSLETDVFPVLDRQAQLLESGLVITGIGADLRLNAARALAATGDQQAQRQVAATEEFIANAGRLRVGMAKSLGANPSNADIQLLETVTAGNINVSSDGLRATIGQGRQLAERQRAAARGTVDSWQAQSRPAAQGPVRINSDEEFYRLPSGAVFIGPDGVERRKP